MIFLSHRNSDDSVFDNFPKISEHFRRFPKILENLSESHTNVAEHYPKISEDCRRLSKTFEDDPKMFRSYTNDVKDDLRDRLYSSEIIDILTSEDMENTPLEFRQ